MKTVKYFKDLGLELIEGDVCETNHFRYSHDWFKDAVFFIDSEIVKFAWRDNTGEKPAFSGDIEFKHNNGDAETINNSATDDYFWMECPVSGRVTHWRPAINYKGDNMKTPTIDHTSEEFWKDAPEGATHWDNAAKCFCKKEGYWHLNNKNRYVEDDDQNQWGDLERYEPHPKPSPVFTKAMADNGELPSVGMECLVLNSNMFKPEWELCTILFMGKFKVVYDSASAKERMADVDTIGEIKFKPLTPPIELIDGKAYQFEHFHSKNLLGFYVSETDEFNVNGNHFARENSTNIQSLTVEGE